MKYINLKLELSINIVSVLSYLGICGCTVTLERSTKTQWTLVASGGIINHPEFSSNMLCCNIGMLIADSQLSIFDLPDVTITPKEVETDDDNIIDLNALNISRYDDLEDEPVEIDG